MYIQLRKDWVKFKCQTLAKSSTLLYDSDPDVALPLLRFCINSRPMFLARTMPPWLTAELLALFDKHVDMVIAKVCKKDSLDGVSSMIRSQQV